VSISDEHDLQERLDRSFQAITPREAPLDQAVPGGTVHPAGPHAPAGLIACGIVGGQHWQVTADKPGTVGARPGRSVST
jgi:hypothetical protein